MNKIVLSSLLHRHVAVYFLTQLSKPGVETRSGEL